MQRLSHESNLLRQYIDLKRQFNQLSRYYEKLYGDYVRMYEMISGLMLKIKEAEQSGKSIDVIGELLRIQALVIDARLEDELDLAIREEIEGNKEFGETPWGEL